MNKISIIVPVYNSEKYIRTCLNSLINQDYKNLEIIIVNDGSTDNSLIVSKRFSELDDRVKVIDSTKKGVSSARNIGLRSAKGEYVLFVDSDDELVRDICTKLLNSMLAGGSDLAMCAHTQINKNFKTLNKHNKIEHYNGSVDILNNFFTKQKGGISACGKLYKRKLIGNLEFDETIKHNEDKLFLYEIYKRSNKVVYLDYNGYIYHDRPQSASKQPFKSSFFDVEKVALLILDDIKTQPNGIDLEKNAINSTILSLLGLLRIMSFSKSTDSFAGQYDRIRAKILSLKLSDANYINKKRKLELILLRLSPKLYPYFVRLYAHYYKGNAQ